MYSPTGRFPIVTPIAGASGSPKIEIEIRLSQIDAIYLTSELCVIFEEIRI